MKSLIFVYFSLFSLAIISCGGDSDGVDVTPEPTKLEAPNLRYPLDKTACEPGVFINDTESKINIEWKKAANATSYILVITNNANTSDKQEITNISGDDVIVQNITLKQNVSYSWYVISKRGTETKQSKTWQFYNAAQGVQSYAPFPATLGSPENVATVVNLTPTLNWTGNDVDNDIKEFEVFVDTANPPITSKGKSSKDAVSIVASGLVAATKYYWQVVTSDDFGNKTKSSIKEFTTP